MAFIQLYIVETCFVARRFAGVQSIHIYIYELVYTYI